MKRQGSTSAPQPEDYSIDFALKGPAQPAEELGINAIFIKDHTITTKQQYPRRISHVDGDGCPNEHIRSVTSIPFRSAPHIAKIVSILDRTSQGCAM
ncbi:MAG: hypothetical protein ACE5NN_07630, partial [Candidatus Bathyarchaeia archaeon]